MSSTGCCDDDHLVVASTRPPAQLSVGPARPPSRTKPLVKARAFYFSRAASSRWRPGLGGERPDWLSARGERYRVIHSVDDTVVPRNASEADTFFLTLDRHFSNRADPGKAAFLLFVSPGPQNETNVVARNNGLRKPLSGK
jgi:hypothetical protein